MLHVKTDFPLKGEAKPPSVHYQPISGLPRHERFHDLQRFSKRDRETVIDLIDAWVIKMEEVVSRLRRSA